MTTDVTPPARGRRDGALHFPLQDGENVLMVCRRHWLYLWPRTIFFALIALTPIIAVAIIASKTTGLSGVGLQVFLVAALIWLVLWAVKAFLNWYRYNNDIWVITDQRIIDSTKTTPFNLKISTADLVNVQDMTVERNGIFQTMLNYGDIVCQTAADVQEFRLVAIPHPQDVQLLVDKERDRERMRGR